MARFDSAIKLATRLIKKNGQECVLRRFDDGATADGDKPWRRDQPNSSDVTIEAVFLNFGDLGRAGERYMPDTEILTGDKLVLISGAALPDAPDLRDRIYRDGGGEDDDGWGIVKVQTLDPNGQQVLHQLQVRH